jgi:hypothetical protein
VVVHTRRDKKKKDRLQTSVLYRIGRGNKTRKTTTERKQIEIKKGARE